MAGRWRQKYQFQKDGERQSDNVESSVLLVMLRSRFNSLVIHPVSYLYVCTD